MQRSGVDDRSGQIIFHWPGILFGKRNHRLPRCVGGNPSVAAIVGAAVGETTPARNVVHTRRMFLGLLLAFPV